MFGDWCRDGFNPRPREAGDPDSVIHCRCFNPRPREAGDLIYLWNSSARGFNPRPREAGDFVRHHVNYVGGRAVSIHARVKRATLIAGGHGDRIASMVSIHARVKRATRHSERFAMRVSRRFQSTPA